jgi:hypothetical protein
MERATRLILAIGTTVIVRTDCGPVPMRIIDTRSRFGTIDLLVAAPGVDDSDARWIDFASRVTLTPNQRILATLRR